MVRPPFITPAQRRELKAVRRALGGGATLALVPGPLRTDDGTVVYRPRGGELLLRAGHPDGHAVIVPYWPGTIPGQAAALIREAWRRELEREAKAGEPADGGPR